MFPDDDDFVLIEFPDSKSKQKSFRYYSKPEFYLTADDSIGCRRILSEIDSLLKEGYFLAGVINFEAGFFLRDIPFSKQFSEKEFIKIGCYKGYREIAAEEIEKIQNRYYFSSPMNNITIEEYSEKFNYLKDLISEGKLYQINYTFKKNFNFWGDALSFFNTLRRNQNSRYNAFIRQGQKYILSLSPELFFYRKHLNFSSRPMKGTIEKAEQSSEDYKNIEKLMVDTKERAENSMIADLLRNDMGIISQWGTVSLKSHLNLESYPTVHQLTSEIESTLKKDVSWSEIFHAMVPGGSVTGVPRTESMKIIQEVEKSKRSVYTGAIGFIDPDNYSMFNIAIRTVELEGNTGTIGIGSGIVYDSNVEDEFYECEAKSSFFKKSFMPLDLIETFLWSRGRYYFKSEHLDRLCQSADFFHIPIDKNKLSRYLEDQAKAWPFDARYRVTFELSSHGKFFCRRVALGPKKRDYKLIVSSKILNSKDLFLKHKSAQRELFNNEYQKAIEAGFDDILFTNEKGNITETAIHNIFLQKEGIWYTPGSAEGLLEGVMRKKILKKYPSVVESEIPLAFLDSCKKVVLVNSVRGAGRVTSITLHDEYKEKIFLFRNR